jgi:ABC-type sugar transport system substrate-binding protein
MKSVIKTTLMGAVAGTALLASPAFAQTGACLITKTDTNPFFVKMKEGATAAAEQWHQPANPSQAKSGRRCRNPDHR